MSKRASCMFCGAFFQPRSPSMPPPSSACERCWLDIRARLSQQAEPDFTIDAKKLPGYFEPPSWVIQ